MRIEYLVIHCTATPEGMNVTGNDIRHWHTDPVEKGGRGWKQVGYSQLIKLDGLEKLVNIDDDEYIQPWEVTNGAFGYNQKSKHICYVGGLGKDGKPKDTRNEFQKRLMEGIVLNEIRKYPWIKIVGHNQINDTDCPAFDVPLWLKGIGVLNKNILL